MEQDNSWIDCDEIIENWWEKKWKMKNEKNEK
jgi:hypothetical protein